MDIELLCPYDGVLHDAFLRIDDYVISDQSVGVIQVGDNSMVMVTSQYEGRVKKVLVEKGEKVVEGMVLAIITI